LFHCSFGGVVGVVGGRDDTDDSYGANKVSDRE
jgi:hypothetical protein